MIYLPVSGFLFCLFLILFPLIWLGITLDLVELAISKLGFSPQVAFGLLVALVLGSIINIPLYKVDLELFFKRESIKIKKPKLYSSSS